MKTTDLSVVGKKKFEVLPSYKVDFELSSIPYGSFSWHSPPPDSLALCRVCSSPCPCPCPSFLLVSADGSSPQSGRKSCPESPAPGRTYIWGKRGGAPQISGRRMVHRGSEEKRSQVKALKRECGSLAIMTHSKLVKFIYLQQHIESTCQWWSWQSSWNNLQQPSQPVWDPVRTAQPQRTRGWDQVPPQRRPQSQRWPAYWCSSSMAHCPVRWKARKKVYRFAKKVILAVQDGGFFAGQTNKARAVVMMTAQMHIPPSPSMWSVRRPIRSIKNSW